MVISGLAHFRLEPIQLVYSIIISKDGVLIIDYSTPIESITYDDETGFATFVMKD